MKLTKIESERVKEYIFQIIRDECDGTWGDDIEEWSIADPSYAPVRLKTKLLKLIDTITDDNNN